MKLLLTLAMMFTMFTGVELLASEFHNRGLHVNEYVYDFADDGGTTTTLSSKAGARALPLHAVVTAVELWVETAVTGASSLMSVGNSASATAYSAAIAQATLAADYVVGSTIATWAAPYAVTAANKEDIKVTMTGAQTTAGRVHVYVHYNY